MCYFVARRCVVWMCVYIQIDRAWFGGRILYKMLLIFSPGCLCTHKVDVCLLFVVRFFLSIYILFALYKIRTFSKCTPVGWHDFLMRMYECLCECTRKGKTIQYQSAEKKRRSAYKRNSKRHRKWKMVLHVTHVRVRTVLLIYCTYEERNAFFPLSFCCYCFFFGYCWIFFLSFRHRWSSTIDITYTEFK